MIGSAHHVPRAIDAGVDLLVAQGYDAGAHTGPIGTFSLVPQIVDLAMAKNIPVFAAGGYERGPIFGTGITDPCVRDFTLGIDHHVGRIATDVVFLGEFRTVSLFTVNVQEDHLIDGGQDVLVALRRTGENLATGSPISEEVEDHGFVLGLGASQGLVKSLEAYRIPVRGHGDSGQGGQCDDGQERPRRGSSGQGHGNSPVVISGWAINRGPDLSRHGYVYMKSNQHIVDKWENTPIPPSCSTIHSPWPKKPGNFRPLPYIPILNPLEMAQGLFMLLLPIWLLKVTPSLLRQSILHCPH